MRRGQVFLALCLLVSFAVIGGAVPASSNPPTFYRDVLPILQKRCQECHRPGEAGPMPLLTYEDARASALKIRGMVSSKLMPPWFSDDPPGRFANDRSLTDEESRTLLEWIAVGVPEGNLSDSPKPRSFAAGWRIKQPDTVLSLPPFEVPATGVVVYQHILVPTGFTKDRWVQDIEVRPGDRTVVHHIQVFVRSPASTSHRSRPIGQYWPAVPSANPNRPVDDGIGVIQVAGDLEQICVYVPGGNPCTLRPGQARLIPAGSDLFFMIHYQATGMLTKDASKIGLIFAAGLPQQRVRNFFIANHGLLIPPGADNHRVAARVTLDHPAQLLSLMPHMHLRGKAFQVHATFPDGRTDTLLNVPRYHPHWQTTYELTTPLDLPAGTTLVGVGTFDNSAANRHNPDPTTAVRWGAQGWDEMHTLFFDLAMPSTNDGSRLFRPKQTR